MPPRIGTAGWSVPAAVADRFPGPGSHLERYARVLGGVEIDSSFYRPHRLSTYARWAAATPPGFRFAVKLPRSITHDARLHAAREPLEAFLAQVAGLGDKLAVLLVQLPPSLALERRVASTFFRLLRARFDGHVACEPRHASWFTPDADVFLKRARVARVSADPAMTDAAARPGGWLGPADDGAGALVYCRWHGAPRMYWSRYDARWLDARRAEIAAWPEAAERWCIFDNTASGAAIENALELDKA